MSNVVLFQSARETALAEAAKLSAERAGVDALPAMRHALLEYRAGRSAAMSLAVTRSRRHAPTIKPGSVA